jgi:hypothetical protein
MESRNDASRPLRVWLLRKPGLPDKRFREYDIAVLLESRDLFGTPRFSYVTRRSVSHLVPQFASLPPVSDPKLEQDRLSVAVSSLVSLKVITAMYGSHRQVGALLPQRAAGMACLVRGGS